jgi:hypothetical protein
MALSTEMPRCYVVYKGWVPGVYDKWEDCQKQVNKFSGNSYKGYPTRELAEKQQPDKDLDDRAPGLAHHCGCSLLGLLVRCVVCVMCNVCNAWTWAIYICSNTSNIR